MFIFDCNGVLVDSEAIVANVARYHRKSMPDTTHANFRELDKDARTELLAKELAGGLPSSDLADLIQQLTDQMHNAAAELQFEVAARYRDEISELKKELRQMTNAGMK